MTIAGVRGVTGEERSDFTKQEGKRLRQRSLSLLKSLLHPVRVPRWSGAASSLAHPA